MEEKLNPLGEYLQTPEAKYVLDKIHQIAQLNELEYAFAYYSGENENGKFIVSKMHCTRRFVQLMVNEHDNN